MACAGCLALCGGLGSENAASVSPVLDALIEADAWAAPPSEPPSVPPAPAPEAIAAPPPEPPPRSREVPRQVTSLSQVDLGNALFEGHLRTFGREPTHRRLASAWAHVAFETGRGEAVECNNLGNLTVLVDAPADYFVRTFHARTTPDPIAPLTSYRRTDERFRAYATPIDGAIGYWQQLAAHYGRALQFFDAGAPEHAALNLVHNGYASAPAEPYAAAIANMYLEYFTRIEPHLDRRPTQH